MYDLSNKAVQRALLTDEFFISFAHQYFEQHAPAYVIYDHYATSELVSAEYAWVRENLVEVATAYHAYQQSFITTASDTLASTPGTAASLPATSETSKTTDSGSRRATVASSDGDLKPAAQVGVSDTTQKPAGEKRKSSLVSGPTTIRIDDDEVQGAGPTPDSAKKPKNPSDLAELVGAELMGSPAFRKALQKYVVDEVVTDAQSRSPARAAGSVPNPSASTTAPIPRPQDSWPRPQDNPAITFSLRSRSNAAKRGSPGSRPATTLERI